MEEKHRVQGAEQPQARLAAQHARPEWRAGARGRLHLQGKAVAEQKGEQQVELGLEQQCDEEVRGAVDAAVKGGIGQAQAEPGRGEGADIHHQNAKQGAAAQGVDIGDARAGVGWRAVHASTGRRKRASSSCRLARCASGA